MVTMKKLDMCWRHSNCDTAIKIHTADAVLRSKLLYGFESSQLIPSRLKRLEVFQLKVLRQMLRMHTTHIDRNSSNQKVFDRANQQMQEEGKTTKIVTFIEVYKTLKRNSA